MLFTHISGLENRESKKNGLEVSLPPDRQMILKMIRLPRSEEGSFILLGLMTAVSWPFQESAHILGVRCHGWNLKNSLNARATLLHLILKEKYYDPRHRDRWIFILSSLRTASLKSIQTSGQNATLLRSHRQYTHNFINLSIKCLMI